MHLGFKGRTIYSGRMAEICDILGSMDTKDLRFKRATRNPTHAHTDEGEGVQGTHVPVDHTPYPPFPKSGGSLARGKTTEAPLPIRDPDLKNNFFPGKKIKTLVADQHVRPIIPMGMSDSILDMLKPDNVTGVFKRQKDIVTLDDSKLFFRNRTWDEESAMELAELIVQYFSRPTEGWYEEVIFVDEKPMTVRKPYSAPFPLLPELALLVGLTEAELKTIGKAFPTSVGRALNMAKDAVKVKLIRGGLSGDMNANFTTFVATNEAGMKLKTEHTETKVDLNDLLARIEASSEPV